MATNTYAPFGAIWARNRNSAAVSFQVTRYRIKKGAAFAVGYGDFVYTGSGGNQGYLVPYTTEAAVTHLLGVFVGVDSFYDLTQQQTIAGKRYWAGTENPSSDVYCFVIDDPDAIFTMQVSGGPVTVADSGKSVDITGGGNPNVYSGNAQSAIDYSTISASTATLPLRVIGISQRVFPGANSVSGSAILSPNVNNWADVVLNTSEWRTSTPT
jgi:hypothetical protein